VTVAVPWTHMKRELSFRFWIESGLAFVLLIATVLWRDWIEIVFGVDPDAGSGALEWTIVVGTAVLTVLFFTLARNEWRRTAARAV
jgi:hypothetical protein